MSSAARAAAGEPANGITTLTGGRLTARSLRLARRPARRRATRRRRLAQLGRVDEAGRHQRRADRRQHDHPRQQPGRPVGGQEQVAGAARPPITRAEPGQPQPLELDGELASRQQVHEPQHEHIRAAECDARPGEAERRDEHEQQDDVGGEADERRREVARRHLRPAGDRQKHHPQPVQRPPERHPRQRPVGPQVGVRGQQLQDPAAEQGQRRHPPAGDQQVVGGHQAVEPRGLGVVGDRVGQRRPRVLKGPHEERDRAGELDRDRVQAGQRGAAVVKDVVAVDDAQQVHRRLGGHGRQPEAQQLGHALAARSGGAAAGGAA